MLVINDPGSERYTHQASYSMNFIGPTNLAHTQSIETVAKMRKKSQHDSLLDSHFAEFM